MNSLANAFVFQVETYSKLTFYLEIYVNILTIPCLFYLKLHKIGIGILINLNFASQNLEILNNKKTDVYLVSDLQGA